MSSLFDRIADLEEVVPFRLDRVEKVTGAPLVRSDLSTSHFNVYQGRSPLFRQVELREPTSEGRGGMVLLELERPVGREAGQRWFGDAASVLPPDHREPAGTPTYHIHRRPWGELRAGWLGDDLTSIVLDATAG